jgi:hypothetical protein
LCRQTPADFSIKAALVFSDHTNVGAPRLSGAQLFHASLHPRLKIPVRIIDLVYFVAEHDDHHLGGRRGFWGEGG